VRDATSAVFDDEEIVLEFFTNTGERETFEIVPNERIEISMVDGKDVIYTFVARDRAGNVARFVSPGISFLSDKPRIEMVNPPSRGTYVLKAAKDHPLLPPGTFSDTEFCLQFRIHIPGDDYRLMEKVTVVVTRQSGGTVINRTYTKNQINDTDFEIDIDLLQNRPDVLTYTINVEGLGGVKAKEISGTIRYGM
jgi:hypothetical protein